MFLISSAEGQFGYSISNDSLKINGLSHPYCLATPISSSSNDSLVLVIALHFGWNNTQPVPADYGRKFLETLYLPAFKNQNFIIAAPNCPSDVWYDHNSEKFILQLIDELLAKQGNLKNKTLITGYSAGGFGTWFLASKYPDMFSLAIPIASMPKEEWLNDWSGVPVYVIQSENDEQFDINKLSAQVKKLKEEDHPVKFLKLYGPTHYSTSEYIPYLKKAFRWYKNKVK